MNWLRMRKVKHGNCIVLKLNDLIQLEITQHGMYVLI
jgi:hypothetical protein